MMQPSIGYIVYNEIINVHMQWDMLNVARFLLQEELCLPLGEKYPGILLPGHLHSHAL